MSNVIRNLLLGAAIAIGTVPVVGQAAQAQPFEIGGAGFSVGFGDDGVEFGTDLYSDDEEAGIEIQVGVDEDDEDDDDDE